MVANLNMIVQYFACTYRTIISIDILVVALTRNMPAKIIWKCRLLVVDYCICLPTLFDLSKYKGKQCGSRSDFFWCLHCLLKGCLSWSTSEIRVILVPSNIVKPSSNFLTDRSKAGLLLLILFAIVYFVSYCIVCSLQPSGHLLGKSWPLGSLVCDVFLVYLPFPHMVSCVMCCIWLYGFLIFVFFFFFFVFFCFFLYSAWPSLKHHRTGELCTRTSWGAINKVLVKNRIKSICL